MNNIVRSRKADYDHVLSLANDGRTQAALDILWELRLKVDLSVYRRALVNITLAALLQRADRTKYARECPDLLDLLRRQNTNSLDINGNTNQGMDDELEHITDLENAAKEILAYNP